MQWKACNHAITYLKQAFPFRIESVLYVQRYRPREKGSTFSNETEILIYYLSDFEWNTPQKKNPLS